jgi:hypothetical protein
MEGNARFFTGEWKTRNFVSDCAQLPFFCCKAHTIGPVAMVLSDATRAKLRYFLRRSLMEDIKSTRELPDSTE